MDRMKSLEFLQNCLDIINHMSEAEVERARQIYREEMEDTQDFGSEFEVILPIEAQVSFDCDNKMHFDANKEYFIDYKMPKYKDMPTEYFECIAA